MYRTRVFLSTQLVLLVFQTTLQMEISCRVNSETENIRVNCIFNWDVRLNQSHVLIEYCKPNDNLRPFTLADCQWSSGHPTGTNCDRTEITEIDSRPAIGLSMHKSVLKETIGKYNCLLYDHPDIANKPCFVNSNSDNLKEPNEIITTIRQPYTQEDKQKSLVLEVLHETERPCNLDEWTWNNNGTLLIVLLVAALAYSIAITVFLLRNRKKQKDLETVVNDVHRIPMINPI